MHPVVRAILQSGANDGKTYLYNAGDEYSALTGGWVVGFNSGSSLNTLTKNASNIELLAGGSSSIPEIAVTTNNAVDLTSATFLKLQFSGFGLGTYASRAIYFIASTNKTANRETYNARFFDEYSISGTVVNKIATLNVSALSGLFYIKVHAYTGSNFSDNACTITVSKVWLE